MYICDKARECKATNVWCKEPFVECGTSQSLETFNTFNKTCYRENLQVKAIPCEEIEYGITRWSYLTKCKYQNLNYIGSISCQNCSCYYGENREKQIVYCTYKHFNPGVKMEYKLTIKNASMIIMKDYSPCKDFNKAVRDWLDMGYGFSQPIKLPDLINIANKYNCLPWLIDRGFIEEEEEEFYSMGDEFKNLSNDIYKLNSWGDLLVGLNSKSGSRCTERPLKVEFSVHKIPASDFHQHFGDNFKKIKE
jgi:hypothetical protein